MPVIDLGPALTPFASGGGAIDLGPVRLNDMPAGDAPDTREWSPPPSDPRIGNEPSLGGGVIDTLKPGETRGAMRTTTAGQMLHGAAGNIAGGAAGAARGLAKTAGAIAQGAEYLGNLGTPLGQLHTELGDNQPILTPERMAGYNAAVDKAYPDVSTPELHGAVDPEKAGEFGGELAPAMLSGPAAPIIMAAQGAGSAQQQIASQRASGHPVGSLEELFGTIGNAVANALTGHFLGKAGNVAPGLGKAVNALVSGGASAAVGAGGTVAGNIIAKSTFDPNRDIAEGLPESAAGGFLLGGATSAFHGAPHGAVDLGPTETRTAPIDLGPAVTPPETAKAPEPAAGGAGIKVVETAPAESGAGIPTGQVEKPALLNRPVEDAQAPSPSPSSVAASGKLPESPEAAPVRPAHIDESVPPSVPPEKLPTTWYRGAREGQDPSTGTFWSASKDASDAFGKPERRKITPNNPLVYDSKQAASDALGLGRKDVMALSPTEHGFVDQAIANDARAKGHDAVVYRNGSFDAPELHLLNERPAKMVKVYHYSPEAISEFQDRPEGTWFTSNETTYNRRAASGVRNDAQIDVANLKLANKKQATDAGLYRGDQAAMVADLKSKGFDGIKMMVDGDTHYNIFDKGNISRPAAAPAEQPSPAPPAEAGGKAEQSGIGQKALKDAQNKLRLEIVQSPEHGADILADASRPQHSDKRGLLSQRQIGEAKKITPGARALQGSLEPHSLVTLEEARKLAADLPPNHPARLALHNLQELEKNPRGTKVVEADTNTVPSGTKVQVNPNEVLTIEHEEGAHGLVRDGITSELPEGGTKIYGTKIIPPEQEAPASAIKPNLFGQPDIESSGIGKQQGMFHEPVELPKPTTGAPIRSSKEAARPENTAEMFRGAGPAAIESPEFSKKEPGSSAGIKRADLELERAVRGIPELPKNVTRGNEEALATAKQMLVENPAAHDELVAELEHKARPITTEETMLLALKNRELLNQHNRIKQQIVDRYNAGEDVSALQAQDSAMSDRLENLGNTIARSTGETGRGLQAVQRMLKPDMTLASMEQTRRAAKGGAELTEPEKTRIAAQSKQAEVADKAVEEHAAAKDKTASEQSSKRASAKVNAEAAAETAKDKSQGVTRDIAAEKGSILEGLKAAKADDADPPQLSRFLRELEKRFAMEGVTDREKRIDAVHDDSKEITGFTRRQTMDALSGYGDFKPISKAPVDVMLRQGHQEMQQISKLQDMLEKQQAPLKTGVERQSPSDEGRRLMKMVNETMRRLGIRTKDPATQLKSALDAIKTRLKNEISDLDYQISTGKKIVKGQTKTAYDAEATALKAMRDAKKADFDAMFGKPEMTDEQRVKIAIKAVERAQAEAQRRVDTKQLYPEPSKTPNTPELQAARAKLRETSEQLKFLRQIDQRPTNPYTKEIQARMLALQQFKMRKLQSIASNAERIASGDVLSPPRQPIELDPEGRRLQAESDRIRKIFDQDNARARQQQLPKWVRGLQFGARWARGAVLSGPSTFLKLFSATGNIAVLHPLDEMAGSIQKHIVPGIASRAPIEGGGLSVSKSAKAVASALTDGIRDAADTLRSGKGRMSELDATYGKGAMPQEALEFFGVLHGAEKAPIKRGLFRYAIEQQAEHALTHGLDPTEPDVEMRMGVEAYKYANRGIFQEDNAVSDMFNRALSRLSEKNQVTGRESILGRTAEAGIRAALPVTKVGTNLVFQTFERAFGTFRGTAEALLAYKRGIENLQPAEADQIMRHLKKGSVGGAALLLGFFAPGMFGGFYRKNEKRTADEPKFGGMRVADTNVPPTLLHNPILEASQLGATARQVMDSRLRKKDVDTQGFGAGAEAALLGLLAETPFIREAQDTGQAFDPYQRDKALGSMARDMMVPQLLQQPARYFDKDSEGNQIQRDPSGLLQNLEMGIPGLRQNVPTTEENKPHRKTLDLRLRRR